MDAASPYLLRPWIGQYGPIAASLTTPAAASLPAMAAQVVERFSSRIAFTTVLPNGLNGSLSYAQVGEMSDAFAAYLREVLRLASGTRVAIQMPNCLAYPVALLGILKAGCVAVNTNPLYTPSEMQSQFQDSGASVVVALDMFADKVQICLPACPAIDHVILAQLADFFPSPVRGIVHAIQKHWNRQIPRQDMTNVRLPEALAAGRAVGLSAAQARSWWEGLTHDDLALLQYTGGTTGKAKGAMLTHGNLLWNMDQLRAMIESRLEPGGEVVLTALPLYHVFAFTVNSCACSRPAPATSWSRVRVRYRTCNARGRTTPLPG